MHGKCEVRWNSIGGATWYLPVLPGFLVSVNQTFPNTNVNCCPLLTQIVDDCRFTP